MIPELKKQLTVAGRSLNVMSQVFGGHCLRAARALAELGATVTFTQQVLGYAGYLHDLWRQRTASDTWCSGKKKELKN